MDEQPKRWRRKDGFIARIRQRNRALDVVFEADKHGLLGQDSLLTLLGERRVVPTSQPPIRDSGASVVEACAENADDIGTIVEATNEDWAMSRMNAAGRSILRMATAKFVYAGTDRFRVIPEWASLAREYSTECSVDLAVGILNRVTDTRARELTGRRELSESEEAGGQEMN